MKDVLLIFGYALLALLLGCGGGVLGSYVGEEVMGNKEPMFETMLGLVIGFGIAGVIVGMLSRKRAR